MSESAVPASPAQAGTSRFDAAAVATLLRRDCVAGVAMLRQAARDGVLLAQALLGQIFLEGRGVSHDAGEGMHWHAVAASGGHAPSMNMLGRCHELGHGTCVDLERAAAWYRKAAASGFDWGMYNYANLLATGRGVKADRSAAYRWYRRAADRGHAKSMNLIGRHYEEGWEVTRDPVAALDWYRRSAEAGDFRGQASYAAILAQAGRVGEAESWLRQAVAKGSPSFLEHMRDELHDSPHAALRALAESIKSPLRPLA